MTFRMRSRSGSVVALLLLAPNRSWAQTPQIPPFGEPPSGQQRAAEEAELTAQAQKAWLDANEANLRRTAARELRGASYSPPVYQSPPPRLSLHVVNNLAFGLSYQFQTAQTGVSTYLDFRINRGWGLMAGGNYLMWRSRRVNGPDPTAPPEFIHTRTPGFHVAAYHHFSPVASAMDVQRFHVKFGCQFLFPLDKRYDPDLPSWFISPTLHLGVIVAAAPIGRHAFIAISANAGVAARIALGEGNDGAGEGFYFDGLYGFMLGF